MSPGAPTHARKHTHTHTHTHTHKQGYRLEVCNASKTTKKCTQSVGDV